jgi:hypothetical protein
MVFFVNSNSNFSVGFYPQKKRKKGTGENDINKVISMPPKRIKPIGTTLQK